MVVGIAGQFRYADFVAYVGGVSIFFGFLFIFVWYVITIPNLEEKTKYLDVDSCDSVEDIHPQPYLGHTNVAYDDDDAISLHMDQENRNQFQKTKLSISSSEVLLALKPQSAEELQLNHSNNVSQWENEILENRPSKRRASNLSIYVISGKNATTSNVKEVT